MKEEYLNKLLNVGNDAVNEAREKYQAERNHELQSVEYDCSKRAAAAMIECKIPKKRIVELIGKYWDIKPSDAERVYIDADKYLFIQKRKTELEAEKRKNNSKKK
ncbi:MAG: hypothetical protein ACLTH4_12210 [Lachnospira eligens]|jgi:hypothetical protein